MRKVIIFIDIVTLMKLGFIGTGKIASSVIAGICSSNILFTKILVSPRNKSIANKLKKSFYLKAQNSFIKIAKKNKSNYELFDSSLNNSDLEKKILKLVLKKIKYDE